MSRVRVIRFSKDNIVDYGKQRGVALAVSLIILLVLTLVVLSGNQNVLLQEKMTASVREAHLSLAAAEAGIVEAENFLGLIINVTGFTDTGANGLYSEGNGPIDIFADATWQAGQFRTATAMNGVSAQFYIEHVGDIENDDTAQGLNLTGYGQTTGGASSEIFKIVSRSTGRDGNSERIVVSYFGVNL
ncbi:PilX N-terminal domain-containing pilus assembly protein [Marinibactrum halimedae]|nr:PilX N-terminal domain-containing pilus assembly protein [Marinibactrum halimedae]MCD9460244.1 PilX N-terminal domain-containing pilus assembly protein [Marinibactrum halimedae]